MIDEKILKSPDLPEIVNPAFLDFKTKFDEVEKNLQKLKTSAIFDFLIAFMLFLKPLAFSIFLQFFDVSVILTVIFFFSLICELYIAKAIWHKTSNFSFAWLPLICFAQLIIAGVSGEFYFAGFFGVFFLLELIFTLNPIKTQKIELSEAEFFSCVLWNEARKYYLRDKVLEFADFRIQKVKEYKKLVLKEKRVFKNWLVLIIYPVFVIIHCFVNFDSAGSDLLVFAALTGFTVFCFLIYQQVKKDFEPYQILAFSLLCAVNINEIFNSGILALLAVDIFFICAFLSLIFRYFRNLLLIKNIDYNFYDLIELLSHKDENISKQALDILQAETKLNLRAEPSLWLEKLSTSSK